jgi:hypothetical protein
MGRDHRKNPRRRLRYKAWIRLAQGVAPVVCNLSDMSEGGARVALSDPNAVPERFELILVEGAGGRPCQLVWRSDTEIGLRFDVPATLRNTLGRG